MRKNNYQSLTEGKAFRVLIRFAIPFLLSGLLQMAYSTVDVYFIGNYASAGALAGAYQGTFINAIITYFFIGLAMGGTILLGQHVGAKHDESAAKTVGNIIWVSFLSVIATTLLVTILGRSIITLLRVPPEAVDEAWNYLRVCCYGYVFIMGYNVVSAVLRSLGDSKAPFIFVLISSVTNIILDYVFVCRMQMAAKGAAIGTISAQGLSFLVSLVYIKTKGLPFRFRLQDIRFDGKYIREILKLGIPISLQSTLNNLSFVIVGALINTMGVYVAASNSIVGNISALAMIIPMAFQSAISAITAQNIGAKQIDRAIRTFWYGVLVSLVITLPLVIVMDFWPETVVSILTKDPDVIRESVRFLYPYSWDCLFVCLVFCANGFFNGCGKTTFSMLQEGLSAFLVRIPFSFLFRYLIPNATIFHVGLGTPLASFASAIACVIYYRARFTKEQLERMEIPD